MKAYRIEGTDRLDALKQVELPDPTPGPGEVLVRMRAASFNFRDTIILRGGYPRNTRNPIVPMSDGAGDVVAVGEGVTAFAPGDRVMPNFLRSWIDGPVSEEKLSEQLGGGVDGVLAEHFVSPAETLVRVPDHLDYAEAATLPCAGLTAWNALTAAGIGAGQTVLLLGTGGVSIFGLQIAKLFGAETIITSSSDDKLALAKKLGADHVVNYAQHPDWHESVLDITNGRGVDIVVEVGGAGTLERSIKSTRVGGTISLIGLLAQPDEEPSMLPVLLNAQTVRGIYVGSVAMFRDFARAVAVNHLRPVIDRKFAFGDARAAYEYFMSQQHVGKVVIEID